MPDKSTRSTRPVGTRLSVALVSMTFGVLLWALHLTVVYGAHTIACARRIATGRMLGMPGPGAAVVLATVLALVAIPFGLRLLHPKRIDDSAEAEEEQHFEAKVMYWLAGLAAFGIFWSGAGAFLVSPCLALR